MVLVTGGGTGIGAAIARHEAHSGARVVVMGRRPGPLAEVSAHMGAMPVVGDATSTDDVRRALDVAADLGGLTTLYANAGGGGGGTVAGTSDADWEAAWRTNVSSAFVCAREALGQLRAAPGGGSIVVISSIAGLAAGPGVAGYVTAKHALIGLTRSLARDEGPAVRANVLCPGWVRTPMADSEMDELVQQLGLASRDEAYALVTKDCPLRRPAEPAEIATIACFLGSPAASAMTGAVVVADGGAGAVDVPTLAFSPSPE